MDPVAVPETALHLLAGELPHSRSLSRGGNPRRQPFRNGSDDPSISLFVVGRAEVAEGLCPGMRRPRRPQGRHAVRGEISSAVVTFVLLAMATFVAYMRQRVRPMPSRAA